MAAKKKARGGQSKAGFVRGLPREMPVDEVIAKAKAAGLSLSKAHVYAIRSDERKKSGAPRGRRGRAPRSQATVTRGGEAVDAQFAKLAIELGLERSQQILDRLRARLRSLLG